MVNGTASVKESNITEINIINEILKTNTRRTFDELADLSINEFILFILYSIGKIKLLA